MKCGRDIGVCKNKLNNRQYIFPYLHVNHKKRNAIKIIAFITI